MSAHEMPDGLDLPKKGYQSSEGKKLVCLAWACDERFVATSHGDAVITIWDTNPDAVTYNLDFDEARVVDHLERKRSKSSVMSIDWSPNDHRLVAGYEDGKVLIWQVDFEPETSQEPVKRFLGPSAAINDIVWVKEDRLAAITASRLRYAWDPSIADRVVPFMCRRPLEELGLALAVSPDRTLIAIGRADGKIELVKVTTGDSVEEPLNGHSDSIVALTWCDDNTIAYAAEEDATLYVIELATEQRWELEGHNGPVLNLAALPEHNLVVTQAIDMSMRLWDTRSKSHLAMWPYQCGQQPNQRIGFAGDEGDLISMGRHDKVFRTWQLDIHACRQRLKTMSSVRREAHSRMDRLCLHVAGVDGGEIAQVADAATKFAGFTYVGLESDEDADGADILLSVVTPPAEQLIRDTTCIEYLNSPQPGVSLHYVMGEQNVVGDHCPHCSLPVHLVADLADFEAHLAKTLTDRRADRMLLAASSSNKSAPEVFLSYNSKDRGLAEQFVAALEANEVTVWWDLERVEVGDPVTSELTEAIDGCRAGLILYSEHGYGSYQQFEEQALLEKRIRTKSLESEGMTTRIWPVLLSDNVAPPRQLGVRDVRHEILGKDTSIQKLAKQMADQLRRG